MSGTEMGSALSNCYRGLMRSIAHTSKVATPLPAAATVLVISGALSCGDNEELAFYVGGNQAYGGSAGATSDTAGDGGLSGDGGAGGDPSSPGGAAGGIADSATGGSGGDLGGGQGGTGAGGAGPVVPVPNPITPIRCTYKSECDDGIYCNGDEDCRPRIPGSDIQVCMRSMITPCGPSDCDEAKRVCDCTNPDRDDDGYPVPGCATDPRQGDCDDRDSTRNPGLTEICDPDDGSRNSMLDEDCSDAEVGPDGDEDGFVNAKCSNVAVFQPIPSPEDATQGASVLVFDAVMGTDCDDGRRAVNPHALEECDGRDNDCDGEVDEVFGEVLKKAARYYVDVDGDHYGDPGKFQDTLCLSPPRGYVNEPGDCNDRDPAISPHEAEVCNGKDDNCDGKIDLAITPGAPLVDMPYEDGMTFECGGSDEWLVTSCPPGRLECNNPSYRDACETIGTTMCNCHACGAMCNFSCGEGACEELAEIRPGMAHTCAIARSANASEGSVVCWGWNAHGQLGNDSIQDSASPVAVENLPGATSVAAGDYHSCAIAGGRVYCWGSNGYRQLGSGISVASSPTPVQVYPLAEHAVRVVSGSEHSCAIYGNGILACWGAGEYGQLGDGASGSGHVREIPSRVRRQAQGGSQDLTDAAQVAAGYYHTCSLSHAGVLECWGENSAGQLGQDVDTVPFATAPLPVPGFDGVTVDEIAASAFYTCARVGSRVSCWGSNFWGELALDSADVEFSSAPVQIPLPNPARAIVAGNAFVCAVDTSSGLHCWGSNEFGERGTSAQPPSVLPNRLSIDDASAVFAGSGSHACAIRPSGAWCWGKNDRGQLGIGSTSDEMEPDATRVRTLNGAPSCVTP